MRDTEYVYAVARIRCNETKLLNAEKTEQLITAESFSEAWKRLGELGYDTVKYTDVSSVLKAEQKKAWELLTEIAPDKDELRFLTVRNSYQNLKAAVKSVVSGDKADAFLTEPADVPAEVICRAVNERNFDLLPEEMRGIAAESYRILTETGDGQLFDTVIDRKALAVYLEYAGETGNEALMEIADLTVAAADMKIALRAARTKKDADFLNAALVPTDSLDIGELKKAALSSEADVISCLSGTKYREAAQLLEQSPVAFEKWCDDFLLTSVENAKYQTFGFMPLVGYYLAKENEIKTVRIIMAAKESGLSADVIRERVRKLYV